MLKNILFVNTSVFLIIPALESRKNEMLKLLKSSLLSPANYNQGQNLIPKIQAYCSPPLCLPLPFSPAAKTEPRAGEVAFHFLALPRIVRLIIYTKGTLSACFMFIVGKNEERNLKSEGVRKLLPMIYEL